MLQPAMGLPTLVKPLLPHPAKACLGRQRATGHAATAGGRAEPRHRRVWLRSHARSARVEPSRSQAELQELQLGAWPSSPLESDLAAAACRVGSCGEDQREDVQWLSVGALEIRSIVVGSTSLLCMRSRSLLELRLRMRRLCGPTFRMQTKMRVLIRTLLETALAFSQLVHPSFFRPVALRSVGEMRLDD